MAKTRMISTDFWSDTWVDSLDPIEKLIYIYCFSNDKSSWCWATEIPIKKIAYETGLDRDMVRKILNRFSNEWRIIYYWWYLILKNFLKHHFNWMDSPEKRSKNNQLKAIINEMKILPKYILFILCEISEEAKKIVESENIDIFIESQEWLKIDQEHRPNAIVPLSLSLPLSSSLSSSLSFNSNKLENSNELNKVSENFSINKIAQNTKAIDINEYDNDEQIDDVISYMKNKNNSASTPKVFWNKDIAEICQKFRDLCEEYWLAYNSTNDRKAAKRLTGKPFFTDKIAVSWCEDLICYIESIFAWNQKLWEYAYAIWWPQPFFYNAEKVYNKLKMSGKWNSETNPAKVWFEEFYSNYPKKEWKDEWLSWYLIFVKNEWLHKEILKWTKNFIEFIKKEWRSLEYIKSAGKFLHDWSWKDYILDEVSDTAIRQQAYDLEDVNIFKEHLKVKYWADWAMSHWAMYQDLKTKIMEKSWIE